MHPRRGEVYFVDLNPVKGHEQRGLRPVVVVSADAINRQPLVVTVVVGTASENIPRDYPTNVRVSATESGLPMDTLFLGFQIRSLDSSRFADPTTGAARLLGRLDDLTMTRIDEALRLVLDLQ
jgi:mRNA interferase MazF